MNNSEIELTDLLKDCPNLRKYYEYQLSSSYFIGYTDTHFLHYLKMLGINISFNNNFMGDKFSFLRQLAITIEPHITGNNFDGWRINDKTLSEQELKGRISLLVLSASATNN